MTEREGEDPLPEITQLFEEFLRAREEEEDLDREAFLQRAGEHGERLRKRIDLYEKLHDLAEPLAGDEEALPTTLGRFRILASVGEGGLGQVYLALDPELGRQVALKVLEPGATLDQRERAWILNEARALARLEHPGVVRVFEVGRSGGRDYVVMEHLTGPTLHRVITELRRLRAEVEETGHLEGHDEPTDERRLAEKLLPFSARVECLRKIAHALAYCHDRGILHRDVKPANLVFDEDDEPRLIDFGLAHQESSDEETKLDITQRLVGSPAYVAPEQVENERTGADPKSDQFSFAVVCYELLTLENPFKRKSRATTLDAIARAEPRPPRRIDASIPADLERVVLHGLEGDPAARYPDLAALASDLSAVLSHRPISVDEPSFGRLLRLWLRRNRRAVAIGLAVVVLVLAAGFVQWYGSTLSRRLYIVAVLEAIEPESLETHDDFKEVLEDLLERRDVAQAIDRSLLSGFLIAPITPELTERGRVVATRLGTVIRREMDVAKLEERDFQSKDWARLVDLETRLCPDFDGNDDLRERGLVQLEGVDPDVFDVTLQQQFPLPTTLADNGGFWSSFTSFRAIAIVDYPEIGSYRYLLRERGSSAPPREIPFVVSESWGVVKTLSSRDPLPELFARTVLVPRGCQSLSPQLAGREDYLPVFELPAREDRLIISAVRMMTTTVSCGQFLRFAAETEWPLSDFLNDEAAESEPAWVSIKSARAYARWAGGRLPSILELFLAHKLGIVSFRPERVEGAALVRSWSREVAYEPLRTGGEYTCDLDVREGPGRAVVLTWHKYASIIEMGSLVPATSFIETCELDEPWLIFREPKGEEEYGTMGGVAFRLVFPADKPEIYDDLIHSEN